VITSTQNQRIKWLQQLEKSGTRRELQCFVVEGFREMNLALRAGYSFVSVFFCKQLASADVLEFVEKLLADSVEVLEVDNHVFAKLAYRESSDGIVGVARMRNLSLSDLRLNNNSLVLVLEAIEKPGNLGAILRTADAASVDAVIIADVRTDVFNPNVVRSSVGTLFTNKLAVAASDEVYKFLKSHGFTVYAAALSAEHFYHQIDYCGNCAIVMGTEAWGLTEFWLNNCDEQIKIPMRGKIDSLNVSVSTAILVFEAMRQRGFK